MIRSDELSSDTGLGYFQRFGKMYFLIEIQIITGFDIFCILDTTNMVKTCDYLHLNKEIHFTKPLKISEPCAGQKLRNKYRVKQS